MIDDTKQNKIEGIKDKKQYKRRSDWYFLFQYLVTSFFFLNFTHVLVEVQFLGYNFDLKGST